MEGILKELVIEGFSYSFLDARNNFQVKEERANKDIYGV